MDPRAIGPAETLRLNTKLFRNCLNGMTAEQLRARPDGRANSAAWVAVHMVKSRHHMLKLLGAELANPLPASVIAAKTIDDVHEWPSVAEILAAWTGTAHALRARLSAMTAAELDAPLQVKFPAFEQTALGTLVFLSQHDAYHLGQLSLLRRQAGLPAMSYTEP